MQIYAQPLPKCFKVITICVSLIAAVFALSSWVERSWQQWQVVRELEGQGIQVYLSGMTVPQEKRYSKLSDFPAPLPLDQGTWCDFSRHLYHGVTALDFTQYAGLNADMTSFGPRLVQLLNGLPNVETAVGWQGPCGCCLTVDWCPVKSQYGPIEHRHYSFDLSFYKQQTEARSKALLDQKMRLQQD